MVVAVPEIHYVSLAAQNGLHLNETFPVYCSYRTRGFEMGVGTQGALDPPPIISPLPHVIFAVTSLWQW